MVIRDPDSLTLILFGQEAHLDISVTDDQWHHVAITWDSRSGNYVGYKDGIKFSVGNDFEKGKVNNVVSYVGIGHRLNVEATSS